MASIKSLFGPYQPLSTDIATSVNTRQEWPLPFLVPSTLAKTECEQHILFTTAQVDANCAATSASTTTMSMDYAQNTTIKLLITLLDKVIANLTR